MKLRIKHIFILALLLRLLLAPVVFHPDLSNHMDWGIRFFSYGPSKFYSPESNVWNYTWPNQPPGTIIIFAIIRKIYELIFNLFWQINISLPLFPSSVILLIENHLYSVLLKLPAIFADIGIAYLIYNFLIKLGYPKKAKLGAALFLFNPVIWYNSSVWGQTDSIINFFFLLALWFLFNNRPVFSLFSVLSSVYVKVSLAIFSPIFLVLFLNKKFSLKQVGISLFVSVSCFALITLFFSYPKEPIVWLFNLYSKNVLTNQLQVITANAFNFWGIFEGVQPRPHSLFLGPLTYRDWGLLAFTAFYALFIYWVLKKPKETVAIWAMAIVSFFSFMFLTNMHERYLYPLFPYLTILAMQDKKIVPIFISVSFTHLLNLYHLWWVPKIEFLESVYSAFDSLLPRLLSLANLFLLFKIFVFWRKKFGKL